MDDWKSLWQHCPDSPLQSVGNTIYFWAHMLSEVTQVQKTRQSFPPQVQCCTALRCLHIVLVFHMSNDQVRLGCLCPFPSSRFFMSTCSSPWLTIVPYILFSTTVDAARSFRHVPSTDCSSCSNFSSEKVLGVGRKSFPFPSTSRGWL